MCIREISTSHAEFVDFFFFKKKETILTLMARVASVSSPPGLLLLVCRCRILSISQQHLKRSSRAHEEEAGHAVKLPGKKSTSRYTRKVGEICQASGFKPHR